VRHADIDSTVPVNRTRPSTRGSYKIRYCSFSVPLMLNWLTWPRHKVR